MRLQPTLFPALERQWRAVDVVLDCFLVEEGKHHGGFASDKNMVKALLVLKQVPVLDDGSLEGFTDFQVSTLSKDNPPVTFEASGKSLHPVSCSVPPLGQPSSQCAHLHLLPMFSIQSTLCRPPFSRSESGADSQCRGLPPCRLQREGGDL